MGLLALLLGMSGCNDKSGVQPTPETYGLLVKTNGQIDISRQQWASGQWSPISVGALVADDDLLEVRSGTAALLCPDLSVEEVSGGTDNSPCPRTTTSGQFSYKGYQLRSGGRGIDDTVPYILFPRQALILDEHPLLRWHDTGATSYTVTLEADGEPIWEADDVRDTELRYPNDAPDLEAGITYQLVVQDTDTLTSSLQDSIKGTGFRLADEEAREAIEEQWERITALDELDEAEQQLAFAVYLISRSPDDPPAFGYWGEAWMLLEDIIQVHNTPSVWRLQGEALRAMRLPNEAEHAYEQALQQAEAQVNREEQAAALVGLWRVTDEQHYFDQALQLYGQLGDDLRIEELREEQ
jgi:hypothetical protein